MNINGQDYTVDKKKPFSSFGTIGATDVISSSNYSFDMSFGDGHHRPSRSGGTIIRSAESIFLDAFQGKIAEYAVRHFLIDEQGFEANNVSDVDTNVEGECEWDSYDLTYRDKILSIKSTKHYGNLLLLETKDWDEEGRYIPNLSKYNKPSKYDYMILVRLRFNEDFENSIRECLENPDRTEIRNRLLDENIEYDIAGFITYDELVDAINEKKIIPKDALLNGTIMDAENYYFEAEDLHGISELTMYIEGTGRICPECGRELVVKTGRYGKFWGCRGYNTETRCTYKEKYR